MSDTVIALREDCILVAEGKSGARPKITDARRIDVEGYGDPLEQWKQDMKGRIHHGTQNDSEQA